MDINGSLDDKHPFRCVNGAAQLGDIEESTRLTIQIGH